MFFSILFATLTLTSVLGYSRDEGCIRYGGGSCCPPLKALDNQHIAQAFFTQPYYVTFSPVTPDSISLDNICYTFFPLPDGTDTYLLYISRVYCDGSNEVHTFVLSEASPAVNRVASAQCSFTDILFDQVHRENVQGCNTLLVYRCILSGDCEYLNSYQNSVPVYGLSNIRRPISKSCLNRAQELIQANGLDTQDYYILPMRLPSQCVTQQVCTIQPTAQLFSQAIGLPVQSFAF